MLWTTALTHWDDAVAPDLREYQGIDVYDGTWPWRPWWQLHHAVRSLIDNDKTRLFAWVREAMT